MRAIIRRLEHLERYRELVAPVGCDARAVLVARLNAIADRRSTSPCWPPDARPTVEEVKQRLAERVVSYTSPSIRRISEGALRNWKCTDDFPPPDAGAEPDFNRKKFTRKKAQESPSDC